MKSKISSINDLVFLSKKKTYTSQELVAVALSHVISCKKNYKWNKLEFDLEQPLQNQFKLNGELFHDKKEYILKKSYSFVSLEDIYVQCEVFEIPYFFKQLVDFLDYMGNDDNFNKMPEVSKIILGQELSQSPCIITLAINHINPDDEKDGNNNSQKKRVIH